MAGAGPRSPPPSSLARWELTCNNGPIRGQNWGQGPITDRGAEHGEELGAGQRGQLRQAHTQPRVRPHHSGHSGAVKPEECQDIKTEKS